MVDTYTLAAVFITALIFAFFNPELATDLITFDPIPPELVPIFYALAIGTLLVLGVVAYHTLVKPIKLLRKR